MTDNVVKFYPADAAKNPDWVLEQAVGKFREVLVLDVDIEGNVEARASTNFVISDIILCMEQFKHNILNGSYGVAEIGGED